MRSRNDAHKTHIHSETQSMLSISFIVLRSERKKVCVVCSIFVHKFYQKSFKKPHKTQSDNLFNQ